MSKITTIKRGDIFWIKPSPYRPAVGSVQQAERPAIIVSNDANNDHSVTYEVVFLTTSPKKSLPTHVSISSSLKPSTALCEQITTISREQVLYRVGTLTEEEMAAIDDALEVSLGLDYSTLSEEMPEVDDNDDTMEARYREAMLTIEKLKEKLIRAEQRAETFKEVYRDLLESRERQG